MAFRCRAETLWLIGNFHIHSAHPLLPAFHIKRDIIIFVNLVDQSCLMYKDIVI